MTLYDRVAARPGGGRLLATARIRHETLHLLWDAQAASGMSIEQLAKALGVRRRTVRRHFGGDGNLPVGTVARYLHAMGYEVELRMVAAGEPRQAVVEQRETRGLGWLVAPGDWPAGRSSLSADEAEKVLDRLDRLDEGETA